MRGRGDSALLCSPQQAARPCLTCHGLGLHLSWRARTLHASCLDVSLVPAHTTRLMLQTNTSSQSLRHTSHRIVPRNEQQGARAADYILRTFLNACSASGPLASRAKAGGTITRRLRFRPMLCLCSVPDAACARLRLLAPPRLPSATACRVRRAQGSASSDVFALFRQHWVTHAERQPEHAYRFPATQGEYVSGRQPPWRRQLQQQPCGGRPCAAPGPQPLPRCRTPQQPRRPQAQRLHLLGAR